MVADTKKVQTLVNKMSEGAAGLAVISDVFQTVLTSYQTHSPDTTGTPAEGHEADIGQAIADLKTLSERPVFAAMVAAYVPSHRGKALD